MTARAGAALSHGLFDDHRHRSNQRILRAGICRRTSGFRPTRIGSGKNLHGPMDGTAGTNGGLLLHLTITYRKLTAVPLDSINKYYIG
jgi:hypothetical protein